MMVKYREATEEEEKAFLESEENAIQEEEIKAMREEGKAWREEQNAMSEEERNAIQEEGMKAYLEEGQTGGSGGGGQEGKYEKKKYIDEDGVWIPRIVTFLIAMLLFWIAGKDVGWFDMFRYR
ncbi:hypothetical protein N9F72_03755 [Gammaproteobacteria bacterium]|nr:hypothetical protein [Gammaproteobacteria bacterium]